MTWGAREWLHAAGTRLGRMHARLVGRTDPIVLMYHRVAEVPHDPWRLAVAPARFAEQLDVLTRRRRVVPLDWLVAELEARRVPDRAVAITFDDGYADVLLHAKPVLERFAAPATVYLTTGAIGRRAELWWDELARLVLASPALPAAVTLAIGGRPTTFDTADRAAAHLAIWSALRPLAEAPRAALLAELARAIVVPAPRHPLDRALDPDEVRALAAGGLVAIGAHTVTHPSLPLLDPAAQRREMRESRAACEALVGAPVTAFAYPFGDHDDASVAAARECGFRHACTVEPGVVTSARQRFRIPRILVDDWDGAELERRVLETA